MHNICSNSAHIQWQCSCQAIACTGAQQLTSRRAVAAPHSASVVLQHTAQVTAASTGQLLHLQSVSIPQQKVDGDNDENASCWHSPNS